MAVSRVERGGIDEQAVLAAFADEQFVVVGAGGALLPPGLEVANDRVLSNEVVMRLNDEIANLNIIVSNKEQTPAPQAIIEEQVISMINSVPGLTYHD